MTGGRTDRWSDDDGWVHHEWGVGDGWVSRRAGEQAEGQRDTGLQRWKGGEADKQTEGRRDRGVDEQ